MKGCSLLRPACLFLRNRTQNPGFNRNVRKSADKIIIKIEIYFFCYFIPFFRKQEYPLNGIAANLNDRPRKRHGYKTPEEVLFA